MGVVFVPMYGDSFFTVTKMKRNRISLEEVFVPMYGDSFFTYNNSGDVMKRHVFVPMYGDSFFTAGLGDPTGWALYCPFAAGISN